jgi:hypothetical protein
MGSLHRCAAINSLCMMGKRRRPPVLSRHVEHEVDAVAARRAQDRGERSRVASIQRPRRRISIPNLNRFCDSTDMPNILCRVGGLRCGPIFHHVDAKWSFYVLPSRQSKCPNSLSGPKKSQSVGLHLRLLTALKLYII